MTTKQIMRWLISDVDIDRKIFEQIVLHDKDLQFEVCYIVAMLYRVSRYARFYNEFPQLINMEHMDSQLNYLYTACIEEVDWGKDYYDLINEPQYDS